MPHPVDAALAIVVFGLSLVLLTVSVGEHAGALDALDVGLTAVASLPLVARRRAPLAVFVITGAASVALRTVADPAGPPLGPTVALYFLAAAHVRPRLTLAFAAGLIVAAAVAMSVGADVFPGTPIAFGIGVWGGAWLAGDRARLRRERMAELEQRALRAEQEAERERRLATAEERTRIARDLHDSAGHAINVILVHAGLGRMRAADDPQARETFATIEEVARQTVAEIDQLVTALREDEAEVEPPGLAALETLARRHRAAGLDVTTRIDGARRALPPSVDRGAYRILQEALTNAARHGDGGAEVRVGFAGDALELTVVNPVTAEPATGGGHGLIGMRERAALLGGSLDTSVRDARFSVRARLPL